MATIRAFSGIDMSDFSVWDGTVSVATGSLIRVVSGPDRQDYHGSFTFNAYGLSGGTVYGSTYYYNGVRQWEVSGCSLPAITVENYLDYNDAAGLVSYVLGSTDTFHGSVAGDRLYGYGGADTINGNGGADVLYGDGGADTVNGGDGADRIEGGEGADRLYGGAGNDVIRGGTGRDRIIGDAGTDTLSGGGDADTFRFDTLAGKDTITDFVSGVDRLEFKATGFPGIGAGQLSQVWSGCFRTGTALSQMDSNDRFFYNTRNGTLYFDRDGGRGTYSPVAVVTTNVPVRASDIFIVA